MAFPRPALRSDGTLISRGARRSSTKRASATIVVGRPVALSGKETASTLHADALFAALVDAFPQLEVVQWDERLTTYEAQRSLSQAGVRAQGISANTSTVPPP